MEKNLFPFFFVCTSFYFTTFTFILSFIQLKKKYFYFILHVVWVKIRNKSEQAEIDFLVIFSGDLNIQNLSLLVRFLKCLKAI